MQEKHKDNIWERDPTRALDQDSTTTVSATHQIPEPNCPYRHISALKMQCGTVAVPGVSRGACFLDGKNPKTRVGEFKHKEGAGGNWEIWGERFLYSFKVCAGYIVIVAAR